MAKQSWPKELMPTNCASPRKIFSRGMQDLHPPVLQESLFKARASLISLAIFNIFSLASFASGSFLGESSSLDCKYQ